MIIIIPQTIPETGLMPNEASGPIASPREAWGQGV